jgi:hypothetical protein
VAFGSLGVTEDYEIHNYELPEDQDNIQKAFRVFADGLVAIPFSTVGTDRTSACQGNAASGAGQHGGEARVRRSTDSPTFAALAGALRVLIASARLARLHRRVPLSTEARNPVGPA